MEIHSPVARALLISAQIKGPARRLRFVFRADASTNAMELCAELAQLASHIQAVACVSQTSLAIRIQFACRQLSSQRAHQNAQKMLIVNMEYWRIRAFAMLDSTEIPTQIAVKRKRVKCAQRTRAVQMHSADKFQARSSAHAKQVSMEIHTSPVTTLTNVPRRYAAKMPFASTQ
jgi:hypothetical protein